jgi:hypothetical protein
LADNSSLLTGILMVVKASIPIICMCLAVRLSHSQTAQQPLAEHSTNGISLTEALPLAKVRLQELNEVGGFAGFAITPTLFLKLSVVFIEGGDRKLFESFLASKHPTTQAMGLTCLSQTDAKAFGAVVSKLQGDRQELTVWTGCCLGVRMTLGELATKLHQDRNFLGHADNYGDFQKFRKKVKTGVVPRDLVTPVRRPGAGPNAPAPQR